MQIVPSHSPLETDELTTLQIVYLLALTWASGALDAICYLRVHVFAANMTGNLVLLGLDFTRHQTESALRSGTALLAFATCVLLAGKVLSRVQPHDLVRAGMLLELPFLVAFSVLSYSATSAKHFELLAAGSGAMAIQSVAIRRLKVEGVATTFVTGTITFTFSKLSVHGVREKKAFLLLGMLLTYVASAAFTAAVDPAPIAAWIPVVCAALAWTLSKFEAS